MLQKFREEKAARKQHEQRRQLRGIHLAMFEDAINDQKINDSLPRLPLSPARGSAPQPIRWDYDLDLDLEPDFQEQIIKWDSSHIETFLNEVIDRIEFRNNDRIDRANFLATYKNTVTKYLQGQRVTLAEIPTVADFGQLVFYDLRLPDDFIIEGIEVLIEQLAEENFHADDSNRSKDSNYIRKRDKAVQMFVRAFGIFSKSALKRSGKKGPATAAVRKTPNVSEVAHKGPIRLKPSSTAPERALADSNGLTELERLVALVRKQRKAAALKSLAASSDAVQSADAAPHSPRAAVAAPPYESAAYARAAAPAAKRLENWRVERAQKLQNRLDAARVEAPQHYHDLPIGARKSSPNPNDDDDEDPSPSTAEPSNEVREQRPAYKASVFAPSLRSVSKATKNIKAKWKAFHLNNPWSTFAEFEAEENRLTAGNAQGLSAGGDWDKTRARTLVSKVASVEDHPEYPEAEEAKVYYDSEGDPRLRGLKLNGNNTVTFDYILDGDLTNYQNPSVKIDNEDEDGTLHFSYPKLISKYFVPKISWNPKTNVVALYTLRGTSKGNYQELKRQVSREVSDDDDGGGGSKLDEKVTTLLHAVAGATSVTEADSEPDVWATKSDWTGYTDFEGLYVDAHGRPQIHVIEVVEHDSKHPMAKYNLYTNGVPTEKGEAEINNDNDFDYVEIQFTDKSGKRYDIRWDRNKGEMDVVINKRWFGKWETNNKAWREYVNKEARKEREEKIAASSRDEVAAPFDSYEADIQIEKEPRVLRPNNMTYVTFKATNTGESAWPGDTRVKHISGGLQKCFKVHEWEPGGVPAGETSEITFQIKAPEIYALEVELSSQFQLYSPKSGQEIGKPFPLSVTVTLNDEY